jgi:hypothetical protein
MREESMHKGMRLKMVAGVAAALAVTAGAGAFIEHNAATNLAAEVDESTAKLTASVAEIRDLRQQLAAATNDAKTAHARAASLEASTVESEQQLQGAEARLESTEARLAQEVRPDLPIRISFRKSLLGSGLVAVILNVSNREIECALDVDSAATGAHFHRALVLDPNRPQEIGGNQGWEFAAGQQVRLSNPQYRPIAGAVRG